MAFWALKYVLKAAQRSNWKKLRMLSNMYTSFDSNSQKFQLNSFIMNYFRIFSTDYFSQSQLVNMVDIDALWMHPGPAPDAYSFTVIGKLVNIKIFPACSLCNLLLNIAI